LDEVEEKHNTSLQNLLLQKKLNTFCMKVMGLTSDVISNFPSLVKGVYPFQFSNYCEDDVDLPIRVLVIFLL